MITQEKIEEMKQQTMQFAKKCQLKEVNHSFKYMWLMPLYQAGYSQKELRTTATELFQAPYDAKTFREYIHHCKIPTRPSREYLISKRYLECTDTRTGRTWVFEDIYGCIQFLKNYYHINISKESMRKGIGKVLSDTSTNKTFHGFTFVQKELVEDMRPPLKDTLLKLNDEFKTLVNEKEKELS